MQVKQILQTKARLQRCTLAVVSNTEWLFNIIVVSVLLLLASLPLVTTIMSLAAV